WAPRLETLAPDRDLDAHRRRGGDVVVPGDPRWPAALDDLAAAAPHALWTLGGGDLAAALDGSVAVIGARACTAYGERVTAELTAGLVDVRRPVVSGGAYGIDAVAHRTTLRCGGRTVVVLAGGVDRPYPAGNARLLAEVVASGGTLVSEVPPGSVPSRSRFLQRNRLIAAGGSVTVVVEAAWRSGALNTAGTAATLLRPVGAVPGPVTSSASAGCHRLMREGVAACVTGVEDVLELVAPAGSDLRPAAPEVAARRPVDALDEVHARTLDALPVRAWAVEESVSRVAGLALAEVRAALGRLELAGLAERSEGRWRRRTVRDGRVRTGPDRARTNPDGPGSG
ncbi:DNA-processing protein DprA, partial [Cellulomonas carbonis]